MIKGTEDMPVGDLISRRVPFAVPIYQRGYDWGREEISDFINDISSLYRTRKSESSEQRKHFFGGLVSVDRFAANTRTGRVFEVVDGQQRLATFMITMSLMVNSLQSLALQAKQDGDSETENNASAHAEQTRKDFLIYQEVEQGQLKDRLRLTLSEVDHAFFERLLLGDVKPKVEKGRDSHKKLRYAFNRIQKELFEPVLEDESTIPKNKLEDLLTLRRCITDDCHAIFIVSDDRYEAYRLFATLNDRGKSLSNGDLLRSHTLELLEGHKAEQERVKACWNRILSGKESQIDNFLHSYFISFQGERVPKRDLFDYFREAFFDYEVMPPITYLEDKAAKKVEERIINMESLSKIYPKLEKGEWPYEDSKVSAWERDRLFRLIKILQHTLCFPLILSICDCLEETHLSELILLLERFVFRYITIVGAHEGKLAEIYYRYCIKIRKEPSRYRLGDLELDLRKLASDAAPDALFESNLTEKLNYSESSTQKRKIKHFLTTLEDHHSWFLNGASGKPKANKMKAYDLNQISIEHIYPQSAKATDIDLKLEEVKHNIGNLTFWAPNDNSAARNEPFDSKKPKYAKSTVMLNHELAELPQWNFSSFDRRRQQLIRKAKKIFRI